MPSSPNSVNWPQLKAGLYRKKNMLIWAFVGLLFILSYDPESIKKLTTFPNAIRGTWVYETGDENIDGCTTSRIIINRSTVKLVEECINEGRSIRQHRIKEVLAVRSFYSNEIKEYIVLTDYGPSVVFDLSDRRDRASVYLQFWITNDYGRAIQLGVFNLAY